MNNPRLTNIIATTFLGVIALAGLVAGAILLDRGAEGSSVALVFGMAGVALGGLVPSPVQRPGA